jgi:hypothetical protein
VGCCYGWVIRWFLGLGLGRHVPHVFNTGRGAGGGCSGQKKPQNTEHKGGGLRCARACISQDARRCLERVARQCFYRLRRPVLPLPRFRFLLASCSLLLLIAAVEFGGHRLAALPLVPLCTVAGAARRPSTIQVLPLVLSVVPYFAGSGSSLSLRSMCISHFIREGRLQPVPLEGAAVEGAEETTQIAVAPRSKQGVCIRCRFANKRVLWRCPQPAPSGRFSGLRWSFTLARPPDRRREQLTRQAQLRQAAVTSRRSGLDI